MSDLDLDAARKTAKFLDTNEHMYQRGFGNLGRCHAALRTEVDRLTQERDEALRDQLHNYEKWEAAVDRLLERTAERDAARKERDGARELLAKWLHEFEPSEVPWEAGDPLEQVCCCCGDTADFEDEDHEDERWGHASECTRWDTRALLPKETTDGG